MPLSSIRLIAAGFLLALLSSFGQTFFISLFGGEIREAFALSHGGFGTVYAVATLASGMTMLWLGAVLDRVPLRLYALAAVGLLAAGAASMALVPSIVGLVIVIFALRLAGQGMMSHASATTMARYFTTNRGKAMSAAALGHPAGEALLPVAAVAVAAAIGWRETWLTAAAILLTAAPLLLGLLGTRQTAERPPASGARGDQAAANRPPVRSQTRREVLRDATFWLLQPCLLAPSAIITAIFFHQIHIVAEKGWDLALFASAYLAYAAASVAGTLVSGPLIDRFGATSALRFYLIPMILGTIVLGAADAGAAAFALMTLCGATQGLKITIQTAMWAELYGVTHLGAIRSVVVALSVASTALAPPAVGLLLDARVAVETLALAGAATLAASAVLAALALQRRAVRKSGRAAP